MIEVLLKALDRLTEPVAILALVLIFANVILVRSVLRHIPEFTRTLGSLVTIIEHLLYDNRKDDDEIP